MSFYKISSTFEAYPLRNLAHYCSLILSYIANVCLVIDLISDIL